MMSHFYQKLFQSVGNLSQTRFRWAGRYGEPSSCLYDVPNGARLVAPEVLFITPQRVAQLFLP
jgi:hypothetical protein